MPLPLLVLGALFIAAALLALGAFGYHAHISGVPGRARPARTSGRTRPGIGPRAFCNQCGRLSAGGSHVCPACGAVLDPTVDETLNALDTSRRRPA